VQKNARVEEPNTNPPHNLQGWVWVAVVSVVLSTRLSCWSASPQTLRNSRIHHRAACIAKAFTIGVGRPPQWCRRVWKLTEVGTSSMTGCLRFMLRLPNWATWSYPSSASPLTDLPSTLCSKLHVMVAHISPFACHKVDPSRSCDFPIEAYHEMLTAARYARLAGKRSEGRRATAPVLQSPRRSIRVCSATPGEAACLARPRVLQKQEVELDLRRWCGLRMLDHALVSA
jgi:hypothetical protein